MGSTTTPKPSRENPKLLASKIALYEKILLEKLNNIEISTVINENNKILNEIKESKFRKSTLLNQRKKVSYCINIIIIYIKDKRTTKQSRNDKIRK